MGRMQCNICGSASFIDKGARKNAKCSTCGSFERTRTIALLIERCNLACQNTRILHIAPERGLAEKFYKIAGENCTFVDIDPARFSSRLKVKKLDLCKDIEDIDDNSYDLIVHSHVIEHLSCNYTYVLYHLHRILSQEGTMVCSIPILSGYFDCCASPDLSDDDRHRRFGQWDHTTRFGRSDLHMHLGKIYALDDVYDLTARFREDELRACNIPEKAWKGYSPDSVLVLKKTDCLLGSHGLRLQIDQQDADLQKHVATIDALYNSTSWKITAPLRALSSGIEWFWRKLRRAHWLFRLSVGWFLRTIRAATLLRTIRSMGVRRFIPRTIKGTSVNLNDYDFLDFGASEGGSIDFARAWLGGRKGLGIDKDPEKVRQMCKKGYFCIEGDITSLDIPMDSVRFVTISHTLEHLRDLVEVRKTLESAVKVATDFLFIRGPYFDADDLLQAQGLKFFWSNWSGHPCHLTTGQLREILQDMGLGDHVMMVRSVVKDSSHAAIHPLNSPRNQHEYIPGLHSAKPLVVFDPPLYKEMVCYVQLRAIPNWSEVIQALKGCHRIA